MVDECGTEHRRTRGEFMSKRDHLQCNTYVIIAIFYKGVSPWFPFQCASFMEEKIEFRDLAVLGKDLKKYVSVKGLFGASR